MLKTIVTTAIFLLAAATGQADAQAQSQAQPQPATPSMKILTAGAFKQVVLALVPAFESSAGVKVDVVNDTAGALIKRIEGGEGFDLVFLPPAGLKTLADQGRVDPASIQPVARVGVGVAVKAGAPLPPLQTVDDFKKAVLDARRVAYIDPASGGSSGTYVEGLFQRLGIADAVRPKAVLVNGGLVAEKIAQGEADLAIHQISEILPVKGATLAGPLPASIQNHTVYGVALARSSAHADQAKAFAARMESPSFGDVIKSKGMERPE